MFQLDKTIVSEELFEKDFVCNLSACKGFCCVDGDAGAPVSEEEAKIMEAIIIKTIIDRKILVRRESIAILKLLAMI